MRIATRRTAQPHQPDADVVRLGRRARLLLRTRPEGRQPAAQSGVHGAGRSQREISGTAGGDAAGSGARCSKTQRPKRRIRIWPEARVQMGRKYNGGHGAAAVDDPPPNGASAGGRNRRWVVVVPDHSVTWDNFKIGRRRLMPLKELAAGARSGCPSSHSRRSATSACSICRVTRGRAQALQFGLDTPGNDYNVYVLGLDRSGRMTATREFVEAMGESRDRRPTTGSTCSTSRRRRRRVRSACRPEPASASRSPSKKSIPTLAQGTRVRVQQRVVPAPGDDAARAERCADPESVHCARSGGERRQVVDHQYAARRNHCGGRRLTATRSRSTCSPPNNARNSKNAAGS